MKKLTLLLILNALILCSYAQIHKNITVIQADSLIIANRSNPAFTILDFRTSGEFSGGHIQNAINIDLITILLPLERN